MVTPVAEQESSDVWKWLAEVPDPEIPVLSIVDLGIVRGLEWGGEGDLTITLTPTYSGCPAMDAIRADIREQAERHGVKCVRFETRLSPAWTTDWIPEEAKQRLKAYGIAPPSQTEKSLVRLQDLKTRPGEPKECPLCGSPATRMLSRYGSTACKALYRCESCQETFDAFKRH